MADDNSTGPDSTSPGSTFGRSAPSGTNPVTPPATSSIMTNMFRALGNDAGKPKTAKPAGLAHKRAHRWKDKAKRERLS